MKQHLLRTLITSESGGVLCRPDTPVQWNKALLMRILVGIFFLMLLSANAIASHFKGGHISYKDLGEGRYEFLIKSYWDKDEIGSIVPRYQGYPELENSIKTVSQTILADGLTVEHLQRQVVRWSKPGLYEVSWRSCCRAAGTNFSDNSIGLFAVVNYSSTVPSSSPQFYDSPIFRFQPGEPINYSMNMQDPDGHEQEYSLEIPYGLAGDAYQKMLETGFGISSNGILSWENPQAGIWLVNVKLREKINGAFTGAYIVRDFLINVGTCELPAPSYTIISKACAGSSNGKVSLSTSEGTGPFSYSLDNGNSFQSSPDFEGLAAGEYTAIVKDSKGCVSQHVHITLEEVPVPVAEAEADVTVVYYGYDPRSCATLKANVTGGTAPYTYQWSTGETTETIRVCPTVTTTYYLTATDALGCSATSQVTITVYDVRAEQNSNKHEWVVLCKNGKPMTVKDKHVEAELEKGAYLGSCDTNTSGQNTTNNSFSSASASNAAAVSHTEVSKAGIKVYPNPVVYGSPLKFSASVPGAVKIEAISLSGRVLEKLYEGNVEASQELSLEYGKSLGKNTICILRITTPGEILHYKVMIK